MDRKQFEHLYLCRSPAPTKITVVDGYCTADTTGTKGHKFEQRNDYFMTCRKCGGIYMFGDYDNGN